MAVKTLADLRSYFETGDKPTQQQFWDFLDSYIHKLDGIAMADVAGLVAALANKADVSALNAYALLSTIMVSAPDIAGLEACNPHICRFVLVKDLGIFERISNGDVEDDMTVYPSTDADFKWYLVLSATGGGNFVPIDGTDADTPVTGTIESLVPLLVEYNAAFSTDLAASNGAQIVTKDDGTTGFYAYVKDEDGNILGYIFISYINIKLIDNVNGTSAILTLQDNTLLIGGSLARGIGSITDYTSNITALDYVQKKYADKAHSFSADEIRTGGTWIDGKPIYRRVVELDSDYDGSDLYLSWLNDIDNCISISGLQFTDFGILGNLPTDTTTTATAPYSKTLIREVTNFPYINLDEGFLGLSNNRIYTNLDDLGVSTVTNISENFGQKYILLEYTKTAD